MSLTSVVQVISTTRAVDRVIVYGKKHNDRERFSYARDRRHENTRTNRRKGQGYHVQISPQETTRHHLHCALVVVPSLAETAALLDGPCGFAP